MKKFIAFLSVGTLVLSVLTGCGSNTATNTAAPSQTVEDSAEATDTSTPVTTEEVIEEPTEESTEPQHEHSYSESITTEATCTETGEKTFSCDCGETYTEPIEATGHVYENYVSNEDATYTADGTETATCICGLTDTRTAEGSKLEYTYTDFAATKYAKQNVNVRDLPSTDGNKLGGLSAGQEVTVTGTCNETGWMRIEYNGSTAYVSNSYIVDTKPEPPKVDAPKTEETSSNKSSGNWYDAYEFYTWHDMGEYMFYLSNSYEENCAAFSQAISPGSIQDVLRERHPGYKAIAGGFPANKEGTVYVTDVCISTGTIGVDVWMPERLWDQYY